MGHRGCRASQARTRACRCGLPRSHTRMTGPRRWRARWRRNRRTGGPRMLSRALSAKASVSWRRRGDTTSAPMPDTFSWDRARTANVGVRPHGAHVRRSTGIIKKPVSSRPTRWAPSRCRFFYRGPVDAKPLAPSLVIALLGPRLRPLRAEAARAKQAPHVIGMVDDLEAVTDEIDDPPARPQARRIAGRFRPRYHQAGQLPTLRRGQLGRPAGGRAGAQPGPALAPMRPFPPADRAPIDTEPFGHDMNWGVTLQEFDRAEASSLELSRAPLWAHAAPPTGEHSALGHYLRRNH